MSFGKNILRHLFVSLLLSLVSLSMFATATDTLKILRIDTTLVHVVSHKYGGGTVIGRSELDRMQGKTLGETLGHVPGVQNAYFGPNSGAPMIRSLSGNRVRVLNNGMSVNDLTGISPNLNVNVDLESATEIDLYKQGASVLYGGKAIGGAVNVRDNVIPAVLNGKKIMGSAKVEAGTNMGHKESLQLSGQLSSAWAWQISGINQRHGNLKIPGNTKAPIAYDPSIDHLTADMAQVEVDRQLIRNLSLYPYLSQFVLGNMDDPKWELSEADLYTFEQYSQIGGERVLNPSNDKYVPGQDPNTPLSTSVVRGITDFHPVEYGIMPNSHSDARSINLGTSLIKDHYRFGLGYRALEGFYGIPGFAQASKPKHSHDAVQQQIEYHPINSRALSHTVYLSADYMPETKFLHQLKLDYSTQFADDRELIGIYRVNRFLSYRHAVRGEVGQRFSKYWTALSGGDFSFLRLNGDGVRRYLPNTGSSDIGAFTMHNVQYSNLVMNVGYRHDWALRRVRTDLEYKPSRGLAGGNLSAREFDLNQFSADLRWDFFKNVYVKLSASHAERAPEVNELYAGNEHFSILVEENGDDRLNKERARTYELSAGADVKNVRVSANFYRTDFKNYLYLAHTGISRSGGFLVKEWRASDTRITGWELASSYRYSCSQTANMEIQMFMDLVKNENISNDHLRQWAEGDYMPNLPTSRYGVTALLSLDKLFFNGTFERYLEQRFLGKNINDELPMPPYSLLHAQVGYQFNYSSYPIKLMLAGSNLLNTEARPQNSILKYLAPLPGRNISLSLQVSL